MSFFVCTHIKRLCLVFLLPRFYCPPSLTPLTPSTMASANKIDISDLLKGLEERVARLEIQSNQPAIRQPVANSGTENATIDAYIDLLYAEAITSLPETISQLSKLPLEPSSEGVTPKAVPLLSSPVQPKKDNQTESEGPRRSARNRNKENNHKESPSSLVCKNDKCKVKPTGSTKERNSKLPSKGDHKSGKADKKTALEIDSNNNASPVVKVAAPKEVLPMQTGDFVCVTPPKSTRYPLIDKVCTPENSGAFSIVDMPTPEVMPFAARRNMWERRSVGTRSKPLMYSGKK